MMRYRNKTAELIVSNEVREDELEKSEICGVRIRSSEVGGSKAGKGEVEDCGRGSNKTEESGTERTEE